MIMTIEKLAAFTVVLGVALASANFVIWRLASKATWQNSWRCGEVHVIQSCLDLEFDGIQVQGAIIHRVLYLPPLPRPENGRQTSAPRESVWRTAMETVEPFRMENSEEIAEIDELRMCQAQEPEPTRLLPALPFGWWTHSFRIGRDDVPENAFGVGSLRLGWRLDTLRLDAKSRDRTDNDRIEFRRAEADGDGRCWSASG